MDLSAVAKSPAAVASLERRLADERHVVRPGIGSTDTTVSGYPWTFGLQVEVAPPDDARGTP
jgi:hypothetical protein